MLSENQIRKIYLEQLDIPNHKIKYMLNTTSDFNMLYGCFGVIKNYGGTYDINTFNIFFDVISEKLSGSDDIEYEFEEIEYENLMLVKKYLVH
jgi:hypothetical protein